MVCRAEAILSHPSCSSEDCKAEKSGDQDIQMECGRTNLLHFVLLGLSVILYSGAVVEVVHVAEN